MEAVLCSVLDGHYPAPDDRDGEILRQRVEELDSVNTPRCGDFVRFADGHLERISHIWDDGVQTSEIGSFYLGSGYVSFSGGLNPAVPAEELRLSGESLGGSCWFFRSRSGSMMWPAFGSASRALDVKALTPLCAVK